MNKKLLAATVVALAMSAQGAFASIARLAVMGSQPVFNAASGNAVTNGVNGSLWYDDDYNVFFNPSFGNDARNYVTVQKGFEGGFFKSFMESFYYGVYFNRGGTGGAATNYAANLVAPGLSVASTLGAATSPTGFTAFTTQRPLDLFVGGDTGVKWGFHLAWAYNRDQTGAYTSGGEDREITARYWHADFGVQFMGLEPFIGLTFLSDYQNTVVGPTNDPAGLGLNEFTLGARYKYEGWTPYFMYKKFRQTYNLPSATTVRGQSLTNLQTRMNVWGLGTGHDTKVADGVHVLKHIGWWYAAVQDSTALTERNQDYSHMVMPMGVSVEAEALSWLTLRAGATMDLINERKFARSSTSDASNVNDKKQSQSGTTTFRVGSTMKFGKLAVDSAFGTGLANSATSADPATLDGAYVGFDRQTFALLSATYRW